MAPLPHCGYGFCSQFTANYILLRFTNGYSAAPAPAVRAPGARTAAPGIENCRTGATMLGSAAVSGIQSRQTVTDLPLALAVTSAK